MALLHELSDPILIHAVKDLQIKFIKFPESIKINADALQDLLNKDLKMGINKIRSNLDNLKEIENINVLISNILTSLKNSYSSTGSLDNFTTISSKIKVLSYLTNDSGQVKLDLDKLLKQPLGEVRNILQNANSYIFGNNLEIRNIKTINSNVIINSTIESTLNHLNNPKELSSYLGKLYKLYNTPYLIVEEGKLKIDLYKIPDLKGNAKQLQNVAVDLQIIKKDFFNNLITLDAIKNTNPNALDNIQQNLVQKLITTDWSDRKGLSEQLRKIGDSYQYSELPPLISCNVGGKRPPRSANACVDSKRLKTHLDQTDLEQPSQLMSIEVKRSKFFNKFSNSLDIANMILMLGNLKEIITNNPAELLSVSGTISAPIIAQLGLVKLNGYYPKLTEQLIKNTKIMLTKIPVSSQVKVFNYMSEKIFLKDIPKILGKSAAAISPLVNGIISAVSIYQAAMALKTGEGQSNKEIHIFTIVTDSAIIVVSGVILGSMVFGATAAIPGLNILVGGITSVQQIVIRVTQGVYQVNALEEKISLTGWEKLNEGWAGFIGLSPSKYLRDNIELKQIFNNLIKDITQLGKEQNFDLVVIGLPTVNKNILEIRNGKADTTSFGFHGPAATLCKSNPQETFSFSSNTQEVFLTSISVKAKSVSRIIDGSLSANELFICVPNNENLNSHTVVHKDFILPKCTTGDYKNYTESYTLGTDKLKSGNKCNNAVAIKLTTELDKALYAINGPIRVFDKNTDNVTSTFIMDEQTRILKSPKGTNYYFIPNNCIDLNRIDPYSESNNNIIVFKPGEISKDFALHRQIHAIIVNNSTTFAPNIKQIISKGSNIIVIGNSAPSIIPQQFINVGENDIYFIYKNAPNSTIFNINSKDALQDSTINFVPRTQVDSGIVFYTNNTISSLNSLYHDAEQKALIVILENNKGYEQNLVIKNYTHFSNLSLQFNQDGTKLNLTQIDANNTGIITNIPPIVMNIPEGWDDDQIRDYLTVFSEFKFLQNSTSYSLLATKNNNSFFAYINYSEHPVIASTVANQNYFSLPQGSIIIADREINIDIINPQDILVRFNDIPTQEYKGGIILHDSNCTSIRYQKINPDSRNSAKITIFKNPEEYGNHNSSVRIYFNHLENYVLTKGRISLEFDRAIIQNPNSITEISDIDIHRMHHKLNLPYTNSEDIYLISFDDGNKCALINPAINYTIIIDTSPTKIKFLFRDSNPINYTNLEFTDINDAYKELFIEAARPKIIGVNAEDNTDIVLDKIFESFILKILENNVTTSVKNIDVFSPKENILILYINNKDLDNHADGGQGKVIFHGWDTAVNRPIFLFKDGVSLDLSNFTTYQTEEMHREINNTKTYDIIIPGGNFDSARGEDIESEEDNESEEFGISGRLKRVVRDTLNINDPATRKSMAKELNEAGVLTQELFSEQYIDSWLTSGSGVNKPFISNIFNGVSSLLGSVINSVKKIGSYITPNIQETYGNQEAGRIIDNSCNFEKSNIKFKNMNSSYEYTKSFSSNSINNAGDIVTLADIFFKHLPTLASSENLIFASWLYCMFSEKNIGPITNNLPEDKFSYILQAIDEGEKKYGGDLLGCVDI